MPEDYEMLKKQGEEALAKEDFDLALQCFEKALELAPEKAEAYKNIGNVYLNKNELLQAEEYYFKALAINPEYWPAYHNLGNIYSKRKDYKLAQEQYLKALELASDNFKLHANLGRLYSLMGNHEEEEESFSKAISLAPDNLDLYVELSKRLLINGKKDNAIHFLEQQFSRFPQREHSRIHFYLAELFFVEGEYHNSIDHLSSAVKMNPAHSRSFEKLGLLFSLIEEPEKAIDNYLNVLSLDPVNSNAYQGILEVLSHNLEKHSLFEKLLKKVTDTYCVIANKNPSYAYVARMAELYSSLGEAYIGLEKYHEAKSCFENVIEREPEQAPGFQRLAYCCYSLMDYDNAFEYYKKAASFDQENNPVEAFYAVFPYSNAPRKAAKSKLFEKVADYFIELSSSEECAFSAFKYLGIFYNFRDDFQTALTYLHKCVEISDSKNNMSEVHFHIAYSHGKREQWDDAICYLHKCLEEDPGNRLVLTILSEIYDIKGDQDMAQYYSKKLI